MTITGVASYSNGVAVLSGDHITFTPNHNYNGPASFTYTVSDGTLTSAGTVNVTVTAVNDDPVANADGSYTLVANTGSTIHVSDLLANDSDPENDTLAVTSVQGATHGSVSLNGTDITFTPDTDYRGPASFIYTLSDGHGGTATGTVNLNIQGGAQTGDANNNVLDGTSIADTLDGAGGNDTLYGEGGNDSLIGGTEADTLYGQGGNDTAHGGNDNDYLYDADGANQLFGDDGNDSIVGTGTLSGGAGNDTLNVISGQGDGGDGNDSLVGSAGAQTLSGGAGNDKLEGFAGDDSLDGGDGNDIFVGDAGLDGNDTINGGAGYDAAYYTGSSADYTINTAGGVTTVIDNRSGSPEGTDSLTGVELLIFDNGEEYYLTPTVAGALIIGTTADDSIPGNPPYESTNVDGSDTIEGLSSFDHINAGAGDDLAFGNDGNDVVTGGFGKDTLVGGSGDDTLLGGTGNDVL